jgi:transposase
MIVSYNEDFHPLPPLMMATSIFRENFPAVSELQHAADTATFIIGLDLHAKTTAICVVDPKIPSIPVFQRKRLPNVELLTVINRFAGKKLIACEAAFGWHLLEDALASMPDITFIPLDARKTSAWIQSSGIKNDAIDAQILCHVCLHGGIRSLAVYRQSPMAREGSKLARHRESLVRQRTALKLQMQAFERDYGANPFTGEIPTKSIVASTMEVDIRVALASSEKRIKDVENLMTAANKNDQITILLQTIPGIGPITAFTLRHKIDTIDRFRSASHLSSYLGLGVRERQSGENTVKGKITKTGDPLLRKLLVQGGQIVRFQRPDLVSLYFPVLGAADLMKDKKHSNKVVTAIARKNLTFVFHIWRKCVPFDLETYKAKRLAASLGDAIISESPMCLVNSAAELVQPLSTKDTGRV